MLYKRIFDSNEHIDWLIINKPAHTAVRRTNQNDAFVIEGSDDFKRRIDEFVEKYCSDI